MIVQITRKEEVVLSDSEVKNLVVSYLKLKLRLPSDAFIKNNKVYYQKEVRGHNVDYEDVLLRDATEMDTFVLSLEKEK